MREPGIAGPNSNLYWLGYGTVLLRAAPEHVKPAIQVRDITEKAKDGLCQTGATKHQKQRSLPVCGFGQEQQTAMS